MTWATSVPILVFLGLSVLDLGPMYATDKQTDRRQTTDTHHCLMPPPYGGGDIINGLVGYVTVILMTFDKQSNGRRIVVVSTVLLALKLHFVTSYGTQWRHQLSAARTCSPLPHYARRETFNSHSPAQPGSAAVTITSTGPQGQEPGQVRLGTLEVSQRTSADDLPVAKSQVKAM